MGEPDCGHVALPSSAAPGMDDETMDAPDFHIVSLSYDVHNKKVFGIISRSAGALSTSVNFNFPYTSSGHQTDDDLRQDMEREVRRVLTTAADFR